MMSDDEKPARGRTRILTDSDRKKQDRSLANYNKTRIKIVHQHNRWMELKEAFRVQTHAEVLTSVPLRMYIVVRKLGYA